MSCHEGPGNSSLQVIQRPGFIGSLDLYPFVSFTHSQSHPQPRWPPPTVKRRVEDIPQEEDLFGLGEGEEKRKKKHSKPHPSGDGLHFSVKGSSHMSSADDWMDIAGKSNAGVKPCYTTPSATSCRVAPLKEKTSSGVSP